MCRSDLPFAAVSHRGPVWILALLLLMSHSIGWADEPTESHRAPRLQGDFAIGKDGRLILLPVTLNGEESLFLLDTGACRSGFDTSLRDALGKQQGTQVLQTPAGRKRVETYRWPEANLGGQPLKMDRLIACIDFTDLRQGAHENIFGVIGMDVLRTCRLQIDFDRGIVRFLNALPARRDELGTRFPIEFSDDGAPYLVGVLAADTTERFLIDTGAQGNSLRSELFDQLLERKLVQLGSSFTSVTVGGEVQGSRGRLERLSVGPFTHEDLRVSRVNPSSLGLRYFSRFLVTFDFPAHVVYLQKGADFLKSEPHATSGMALLWIEGNVIVKSVKSVGPAEKAGVRSNDVILRVNGKDVSEYDHFSLRQLMTSESGTKVQMQIRRAGREIKVELILDED